MQLLNCRACLWHCLRAVAHRAPLAPQNALVRRAQIPRSPSRALALALQQRRGYAKDVQREYDAFDAHFEREREKKGKSTRVEGRGKGKGKPKEKKPGDEREKDLLKRRTRQRASIVKPDGPFREPIKDVYHQSKFRQDMRDAIRKSIVDPGHKDLSPTVKRRLKQELEWFGDDPRKLADTVQKRLAKGKAEETLTLLRFASSTRDCTVGWNHTIDHFMRVGRCSQALKLYNEMKKRGQKPDSYTYLIVLRGLAGHAHVHSSVGNALSVYHSMSAPNSQVPPATMHANATLRVCARAHDMDALWGVAAKMPEGGPGAPDGVTYTTILQALRHDALVVPQGMSADDTAQKREASIVEGRRLWEDVVARWRSGNLIVDEDLVCAMGQLLLIGQRPRDWDDVLSLFEQTMDIPRLMKHLGSEHQKFISRLPHTPEDMKAEDSEDVDPADHMRRGGEFDPINLEKTIGHGRRNMAYAKPSQHSLHLILDACLKLNARGPAEDYWNLLTGRDSWGVAPDENNLHMYLRILRQARSSAAAVAFLEDEFGDRMGFKKAKTFRLAMSTCVRDKNNPNVVDHANIILENMTGSLLAPDMRTLAMYTNLMSSLPGSDQVRGAIEPLHHLILKVGNILNYRNDDVRPTEPEDREAAMDFISGAVSCYDRLMNLRDVSQEEYTKFRAAKSRAHALLAWLMGEIKSSRSAKRSKHTRPTSRYSEQAASRYGREGKDDSELRRAADREDEAVA